MRVAVVGAGITGLSVALHLAESGAEVVVHERAGIGAEASGVQPGGVRQQWSTRVNCLLARESIGFYRDVAARLEARTEPVLEPCGYVFLAHSAERRDALAARCRAAERARHPIGAPRPRRPRRASAGNRRHGRDGRLVLQQRTATSTSRRRSSRRSPKRVAGTGSRSSARPIARLVERPAGWTLERVDAEAVEADAVVVAAGYDAPTLLATVGIDLPIEKEARYLLLSDPIADRLLEPLIVSAERHFAAKHLRSGRVLASDLAAERRPRRGCGGMAGSREGKRAPVPARPRVRHLPARRGGLLRRHPRPPAADRARSRAASGWPPASAATAS